MALVATSAAQDRTKSYKVVIVGDSSVGKTSLIYRLCEQQSLTDVEATIGVDLQQHIIEIEGESIKLLIWDTAGQERYIAITRTFYRDADATIFVYDITNRNSFNNLNTWIDNCNNYAPEDALRILVANKCDQNSVIPRTTVQKFADEQHMLFFETSTRAGSNTDNVEAIFFTIAQKLKNRTPMSKRKSAGVKVTTAQLEPKEDSWCSKCQLL